MKQLAFLHKALHLLRTLRSQHEVDTSLNKLCSLRVCAIIETVVVEAIEQVAADFKFLLEFQSCRLVDVGVTKLLTVALGIVLHSLFQCASNTHIVNNQTTFLLREYTVDTGDSLHQVMPLHGFIDIHRCERRHIKSCQPHIHHDSNLHGRRVLLKQGCILLVHLGLYHVVPFLFIGIGCTCHHMNFLRPFGAKFKYLAVYFDRSLLVVSHNHCLACQLLLAVLLIVIYYVTAKAVDGIRMAEYLLDATVVLPCLVDLLIGGTFFCKTVKLVVKFLQHLFVQFQVDHTAFVIDWASGTILYGLCHVINIDVIAKHLLGVAVSLADGRARKSDERCIRQSLTHQQRIAFLHALCFHVPMLVTIL